MTTTTEQLPVSTKGEDNLIKIINRVYTTIGIGKEFAVSDLAPWMTKNKITSALFYNYTPPEVGVFERVVRGRYILKEYSDFAINKGIKYWKGSTERNNSTAKTKQKSDGKTNGKQAGEEKHLVNLSSSMTVETALKVLKESGEYSVSKRVVELKTLF